MSKERKRSRFTKEPDWAVLADYVSDLKARLGLGAWTIALSHEPCADRYMASVAQAGPRRCATIFINRRWETYSPDEKRQTLLHELCHIFFFDLQWAVAHVHEVLDSDVHTLLTSIHTHALEYAVDALADAFAPLMPLPPE